jgi:hypothetical protein
VNGEGKKANLFVADLAGVENEFQCSSGKTIMDFMNIANNQGFKTEDNALIPYYSLSGSVLSEKAGGAVVTNTALQPVFNELPDIDPMLYSKENPAALAKLFDFNNIIQSITSIPKWNKSYKNASRNVNTDMLKRIIHQLLGIQKGANYETNMKYYEHMLNMEENALDNNHGKYYDKIIDYNDDNEGLTKEVQKIINTLLYDPQDNDKQYQYGYLFESNNAKDVDITPNPPSLKNEIVGMLNKNNDMIISKEQAVEAITEMLVFNSGSKKVVKQRATSKQTTGINANYERIVNNSKDITPYTLTEMLRDLKNKELQKELTEGEDKINIYDEMLTTEKLSKLGKGKQERLISNKNYKALYDLLYEILNLNMKRIKYGKEVCENRREEGYFINSSLKLIRDTVNEILIEKGKKVLLQAPDIISDCLEDYCPTLSDCFQLTPVMNKKTEYSIIFDDVYQYLTQSNVGYTKTDFYKEVLVCVFCVLNISRKANDPPLVSYLDMNDLKKQYYYTEASIDAIKANVSKLISNVEYYNKQEENKHGLVDVVQKDLDELKELNGNITSNSDGQAKSTYKNTLERVMNQVDNSNAISTMGTLIFTDKIAKLNTTDTVCQPTLGDDNSKLYKHLYPEMKESTQGPAEGLAQETVEKPSREKRINRNRNRNKSKRKMHVSGRPGKTSSRRRRRSGM